MKPETLTALHGSIAKWQAIVDGTGDGVADCPLCERFFWIGCGGCPVFAATGKALCRGTPYAKWVILTDDMGQCRADTPERKAAAQAELAFLQSLLP